MDRSLALYTCKNPLGFAGWATDIGEKRTQNQDTVHFDSSQTLAIVADGMGGHFGGQVASSLCVEIFVEEFKKSEGKGLAVFERIRNSAEQANMKVLKKSMEQEELRGMGTTTTVVHVDSNFVYIGHVGDSRCYVMNRSGIWQLTRDHSLVQEKFNAGMITRDQMRTDRMKNIITRSVGYDHNFSIEFYQYPYQEGDILLMCSDGLTGPLTDQQIIDNMEPLFRFQPTTSNKEQEYQDVMQQAIETLIVGANMLGGEDNVSVLLFSLKPRLE